MSLLSKKAKATGFNTSIVFPYDFLHTLCTWQRNFSDIYCVPHDGSTTLTQTKQCGIEWTHQMSELQMRKGQQQHSGLISFHLCPLPLPCHCLNEAIALQYTTYYPFVHFFSTQQCNVPLPFLHAHYLCCCVQEKCVSTDVFWCPQWSDNGVGPLGCWRTPDSPAGCGWTGCPDTHTDSTYIDSVRQLHRHRQIKARPIYFKITNFFISAVVCFSL